ncbi:MAG: hypothetical protein JSS97_00740 [Actinobacteria bacterium]|nr:hypothetical protein [Actinomycetota bacterium]
MDVQDELMEGQAVAPQADPVAEGRRLVALAGAGEVEVYLLGGVAIELRRPVAIEPLRRRTFGDIDLITTRAAGRKITQFLGSLGYEPDHEFNAINGRSRMLFQDPVNERDLDVLIGEFAMCHEIPVLEEAVAGEETIPLADLLLTKLQIVELNEKDLWDIYNLIYVHAVERGDGGEEAPRDGSGGAYVDLSRIARLCAKDWGLWRTVTGNLARIRSPTGNEGITTAAGDLVAHRVEQIQSAIDAEKKSRGWRLRSRVGDRVQWYEEPEEAH